MKFLGKNDRPAGDPGQWVTTQDNPTGGAVAPVIERMMDVGIDGRGRFSSAKAVADLAMAEYGDVDPAIDALLRSHLRLVAANGFLTSLGGFVALPVALPANVAGFYLVATRLVAGIASARGHDISQPEVRSAVMLALVGADADDLLKKTSGAGAGRLVNLAAERLPGPVMMAVRKGFTFRLFLRIARKSLTHAGRMLPLAGGFVGAGLDTYQLRRIADHARLEFAVSPASFA